MSYKDLTVLKKAFELAMQVFEVSKTFPKEETYSQTIKSEDHHDLFVPILRKDTGNGNILHSFPAK